MKVMKVRILIYGEGNTVHVEEYRRKSPSYLFGVSIGDRHILDEEENLVEGKVITNLNLIAKLKHDLQNENVVVRAFTWDKEKYVPWNISDLLLEQE